MTWLTRHIDVASGPCRRAMTPSQARWRVIKTTFARSLPVNERRVDVRKRGRERGIRQRRLLEHSVRNHEDFAAHVDFRPL